MNAIIIRFVFLFTIIQSSDYCFSQIDTAIYYLDKNQGLCIKEKAMYMAKRVNENDKFKLSYFVLASGKLVLEIMYTDFTLAVMDGPYAQYDEDGKPIAKGTYINNKQEGYWSYWNGGRLTDSVLFVDGLDMIRITFSYYQKGTLNSRVLNDSKTKTSEITSFDEEGNRVRYTKWINGTGDQIYYYSTGQVKTREKYEDNKIVSTQNYETDGSEISEKKVKKKDEKIVDNRTQVVTGAPSYPGGSAGFQSFFSRNFKRPESLGRSGFSELVTVTFYLDKSGFAYNIRVSGASNRDIEIEVLTVFRRMAAWVMNGHQSFGPITYTISL